VVPFNALWNANFEKNHLEFLAVLDSECNSELLRHFDLINELRKAILYGFLQKIISTYKTLSLDYLSRELRVPKATIVQILVEMIMDRKIIGLIDETLGVFINEAGNEQTQQNKRTVQLLNSMVKVVEEVTSRGTRGAPVSLASY
jgi:hypothetical protein